MLGFEPDLSVANPARSSPRKALAGKGKGTVGRTDGREQRERLPPRPGANACHGATGLERGRLGVRRGPAVTEGWRREPSPAGSPGSGCGAAIGTPRLPRAAELGLPTGFSSSGGTSPRMSQLGNLLPFPSFVLFCFGVHDRSLPIFPF